jgi:hypothetical protein
MELNKVEVRVVAEAEAQANDVLIKELAELQLALCGGGVGEVVFG